MKDFSIQLTKLSWVWWLLGLSPLLALAQEPEIITDSEASQVYEGEPFTYSVTLNHVENPIRPELDNFEHFSVQPAGETDLNSQQITIINGVRTEVVRRGRQYQFRLIPLKSGELIIPAPKVTLEGKVLEGKPMTIRVIAAESQDIVRMSLQIDREIVYPTQPFTLSLNIAVKGLPNPANQTDPISVQPKPPQLSIDWLDDDRLPKTLQPELPWQEVLQKLISRRGDGFSINSIRTSSAFSIFEDSALAFHPRPKIELQSDATGKEIEYWNYEFKRTFTSQLPGKIDFAAASIKGNFATKVLRNSLQGEPIYAKSNTISVVVRDVPEENRPQSYIGAIGKFSLVTELSPTEARVGDPLTLTLSLNGTGSLEDASPPNILAMPEIKTNFKVYEGTSQTKGESKKFTYSLRALNADIKQLPTIPVTYFDVDQEQFVTLQTQPITLDITTSQKLSDDDVLASPSNATGDPDSSLQIATGGLFANYSVQSFRDEAVDPLRWFVAWTILVGGVLVFNLSVRFIGRRNSDPRLARRRGALTAAQKLLAEATMVSKSESDSTVIGLLRRSIMGLVSDLLVLPEHGLTVSELNLRLEQQNIELSLRQQVRDLLERLDAAKFGASTLNMTELIPQTDNLIQRLHHQLNNSTKSRSMFGLTMTLIIIFATGCTPRVSEKALKLFIEAEQSFENARLPEDFQNVAQRYQQIIDDGVHSGVVYFNQGNAWAKAGQPGRAIAAYRQALRYQPRDTYVQANLNSTLASLQDLPPSTQGVSNLLSYIHFWKDWLSLREVLWFETVLIVLSLISATCSWLRGKFKSLSLMLFVPTLILGGTCFLDWRDQFLVKHGVVISGPVIALKGDGENYQPAFTGELAVGTEFQVVEQRREWIQITIDGLGRGWVKVAQVAVY